MPAPPAPERARFKPGKSGNRGGRPKGLSQLARAVTKDGQELVAFFAGIFHGDPRWLGRKPTAADRIEAANGLADRGWGKALQGVEVTNDEPIIMLMKDGRDF